MSCIRRALLQCEATPVNLHEMQSALSAGAPHLPRKPAPSLVMIVLFSLIHVKVWPWKNTMENSVLCRIHSITQVWSRVNCELKTTYHLSSICIYPLTAKGNQWEVRLSRSLKGNTLMLLFSHHRDMLMSILLNLGLKATVGFLNNVIAEKLSIMSFSGFLLPSACLEQSSQSLWALFSLLRQWGK